MNRSFDIICIGMALVDSIIKGFDPNPISASGYRAASGSLNVGGEAVNEAMAAAKLGMKTGILCSLGKDAAGDMIVSALSQCGVNTIRHRLPPCLSTMTEQESPSPTVLTDIIFTRKTARSNFPEHAH